MIEIADGRAADTDLDVVPRRALAVSLVEVLGLRVAAVLVIVAPPVAQVDAADERHVAGGIALVPDQDQLLMVGTGPSDPLVEKDLATVLVDFPGQRDVMLQVEARDLRVRPPHQPAHGDAARRQVREDAGQVSVVDQPHVGVAPPIGERH